MGWNYISIPKLQRCNRWSLGMDKYFHSTLYWACDYLSMLGLKLNHVSKRSYGPVPKQSLCHLVRPPSVSIPAGGSLSLLLWLLLKQLGESTQVSPPDVYQLDCVCLRIYLPPRLDITALYVATSRSIYLYIYIYIYVCIYIYNIYMCVCVIVIGNANGRARELIRNSSSDTLLEFV